MAEQTSLVAQQVRLMHWAEQIRECQNRPEGMDVSTWCEQNNITKANYYYPLKRVRQMYLDQLPEAEKPAFVELPRLKAERTATVLEIVRGSDPNVSHTLSFILCGMLLILDCCLTGIDCLYHIHIKLGFTFIGIQTV